MTATSPPPISDNADGKEVLHWYLRRSRQALRWKMEGLSERQLRMPMTPTGTNILGVLKHVTSVELEYLTDCVGQPTGIALPWFDDGAEINADMFATEEETLEGLLDWADRCAAAVDASIESLTLESPGQVPWWGKREVTLGRLLVHMVDEYARHLGQIDVLREMIDSQVGLHRTVSNLPGETEGADAAWWEQYHRRLQSIAEQF